LQSKPGDVLIATHRELEGRTKTGLAQATVRAAEEAATAPKPLPVSNTAHLRDLAASAARIFGWDKKEGPQTQINQLCISAEHKDAYRALSISDALFQSFNIVAVVKSWSFCAISMARSCI